MILSIFHYLFPRGHSPPRDCIQSSTIRSITLVATTIHYTLMFPGLEKPIRSLLRIRDGISRGDASTNTYLNCIIKRMLHTKNIIRDLDGTGSFTAAPTASTDGLTKIQSRPRKEKVGNCDSFPFFFQTRNFSLRHTKLDAS